MGCASSVDCKAHALKSLKGFDVGQVISKGDLSVCREATEVHSKTTVVIKSFDKSSLEYKDKLVRAEIEILERVQHPSCIKLLSVCESNDSVHLVTERASGGTLQGRIDGGSLKEIAAANITVQVLDALSHLHALGICHRDLTPSNIVMLSNNEESNLFNKVKISDFGLAVQGAGQYAECMDAVCGTPHYAAPEILRLAAEQSTAKYSCKVDVWSAGCTLFAMLSGEAPFQHLAGRTVQMISSIIKGEVTFNQEAWRQMSAQAKELVSSLMLVDVEQRPTATKGLQRAKAWLSATRRREKSFEQLARSPSVSGSEWSSASTEVAFGEATPALRFEK